jgi:hypothetical protein
MQPMSTGGGGVSCDHMHANVGTQAGMKDGKQAAKQAL